MSDFKPNALFRRGFFPFMGAALFVLPPDLSRAESNSSACFESAQVAGANTHAGGLLNVRTGPGREHQALQTIRMGERVEVCGFQDDWTQIVLGSGVKGWVSSRFLVPIEEGEQIAGNRASAPPTTGFRAGEAVRHQPPSQYSSGFTSHSGESDGLYYRYYSDGSGSLSDSSDMLKPALWKVKCETDAMSDERICNIHDDAGVLFLILSPNGKFTACAMRHDFPGRTAMIRLDKEKPVNLGESGCTNPVELSGALRNAREVTVRSVKWPNDWNVDQTISLRGLDTAFEFANFLKSRQD